MKARKTLSSWLFNRYLLIIRNEENFAEKTTTSFTYAKVILLAFFIFLITLGLSFFLITTLLDQWFDPRHAQMETKRELLELNIQMDSLIYEVDKKQQFIMAFQRILSGDTLDWGDSRRASDTSTLETGRFQTQIDADYLAPIDSQLRQEFEQSDMPLITFTSTRIHELQEFFLFSPITGFVSNSFNLREGHFGVDIVTRKNEPVKCIADGTVIMASWTQDSGYVIAVQHRANLISVYKHNADLLKKVGNFVNAGEIISIVGNTGELTDGPHLHFELWYNGNPVNPEDFISF